MVVEVIDKSVKTESTKYQSSNRERIDTSIFKKFCLAAAYVTILPIAKSSEESLIGLSKYLPAVGLLIGSILGLLSFALIKTHQPSLLLGLSLTIAWIIITGGLHLDGLMDTADGIFSHQSRERILEIMSDSRVGNFGVIAGLSVIITKIVCLSTISTSLMLPVLLLVPVWARWCETYAIGCFPYLKLHGKGKIWHDTTSYPCDLYVALLLPIGLMSISLLTINWVGLVISLSTLISGIVVSHWFNRKLGGHTGDTYGAVVELAETSALFSIALMTNMLRF